MANGGLPGRSRRHTGESERKKLRRHAGESERADERAGARELSDAGVRGVADERAGEAVRKKPRRRVGVLTIAGLLLIMAALGLAAFNLMSEQSAGADARDAVESLAIEREDLLSGQMISPDTPMPTEEVDGNWYVGVLRVPSLGLELPVMSDWSYPDLRVAPCRYAGSAYADNMVIAAHNYSTHFGRLGELSYGAEVSFTDVRGNVFVYKVSALEKLGPYDVVEMVESEYDLTLFTCTFGGANRVTVRCEEVLM